MRYWLRTANRGAVRITAHRDLALAAAHVRNSATHTLLSDDQRVWIAFTHEPGGWAPTINLAAMTLFDEQPRLPPWAHRAAEVLNALDQTFTFPTTENTTNEDKKAQPS